MEKILILGATGNIGLAVLKQLKEKQVTVIAGVRNHKHFNTIEQLGVIPLLVDFSNQEDLNKALKGIDRVFLVTPLMQNPEHITQLVVNAALQNNVKHLVRSTALGADSKGQITMARWAGKSEDVIKDSGLQYTFIRPNNFLENFTNFHSHSIKGEGKFYAPNGEAKCGMVSVEDIAEVATIALTSEHHYNQAYNLSGLALSNTEYAETLSLIIGKPVNYVDISEEMAKAHMMDNQMPEWLINAMMELNYIMKQGWTAEYSEDFKRVTGKEYTSAKTFFQKNKLEFID